MKFAIHRPPLLTLVPVMAIAGLAGFVSRTSTVIEPVAASAADSQTAAVVAATGALVNAMSIEQRDGLKVSAMSDAQRGLLVDLIAEWAGILNDAYAAPRMRELEAGLDETYFAWSGPTTHDPGRNGSAYYRIQGPKLLIEFSPQGVGGDPTMHVHTMYRDPTNDYGRAYIRP